MELLRLSVIVGANNTFLNNISRNVCIDLEPNNASESAKTTGNVFDGDICVFDGKLPENVATDGISFGVGPPFYSFGYCTGSCATSQTVRRTTNLSAKSDFS